MAAVPRTVHRKVSAVLVVVVTTLPPIGCGNTPDLSQPPVDKTAVLDEDTVRGDTLDGLPPMDTLTRP